MAGSSKPLRFTSGINRLIYGTFYKAVLPEDSICSAQSIECACW